MLYKSVQQIRFWTIGRCPISRFLIGVFVGLKVGNRCTTFEFHLYNKKVSLLYICCTCCCTKVVQLFMLEKSQFLIKRKEFEITV